MNGSADINYKEALTNLNIDMNSADPFNQNWVIRAKAEMPNMTIYRERSVTP